MKFPRVPHTTLPLLALLLLAPIIVHMPELLGWISCWPLPEQSGLAVSVTHLAGGQCAIDGNVGGTMEALGHLSAQDWLSLRLPWWDPYAGVGMPLAAGMQPASFFLPFVLLLHFKAGVLLLKITMQCLAGLCMFACLREMNISRAASLLGALLFEFNGTFAWYGDAPMLPIAFLPLLIAGIERSRRRALAGQPGGIAAIAAGIAFSLLAGFPETAFVDGVLALLWCGVVALGMSARELCRFGAKVCTGGMIGVALAAPVLIPFAYYLAHGSMLLRGDATVDRMAEAQAGSMLLPALFGPPNRDSDILGWTGTGGYFGAAAVVFAWAGLPRLKALRGRTLLALGWILFWVAAFIGEPHSRAIWLATPVLKQAMVSRYGWPSLEFCLAVLAALALDAWRARPLRPALPAILVSAGGIAAVAFGIGAGRISLHAHAAGLGFAVFSVVWAVVLVAGVTVLVRRPANPRRLALAVAFLAVDAVAWFVVPITAGLRSWSLDMAPVEFLAAQPGFARVYGIGQMVSPNYGSYFGVATIRAFSLPVPANWAHAGSFMTPELLGLPFFIPGDPGGADRVAAFRARLEALGVGFVIVPRGHDTVRRLNDAHFVQVFQSASSRIYGLPGAAPYFEIQGGPCSFTAASRDQLITDCQQKAVLIRRELYYPGWRVRIDGRKATIEDVGGLFQAVNLPAGTARIAFRYAPPLSNLITGLFLGGLLMLAMSGVRSVRLPPRTINL
jgi:hypothetical protein